MSCYILGNGSSIKFIDINDLKNLKSISINLMVLHKDFKELDTCGYVLPESYFFYRYFINPYDKKLKENIIGNLFRKKIGGFQGINLFTSVTNFLGAPIKNTYYLHHFGERTPNKNYIDLTNRFSFMSGGLYAAIGLAIYYGFSKAILVGCDYLMTPRQYGHFYSAPRQADLQDESNAYPELLLEIKDLIDLEILCVDSSSQWLNSIQYSNLSTKPIKYRENTNIVDKESLNEMHRAHMDGQFPSRIFVNEKD